MTVSTRPARADERDWLYRLHRATMRQRVEAVYGRWDEAWQRNHFNNRDPREHAEVIEADGRPAGALYTGLGDDGSLYISLIEVLPTFQSQGVGSRVLTTAIQATTDEGPDVTLRTRKGNPAARLYRRLGFIIDGETDTHLLMRRPRTGPTNSPHVET